MNQKVSTSLGTAILLVMAFTAGYFVWVIEKDKWPVSTTQFFEQSDVMKPIRESQKKEEGEVVELKTNMAEPEWLVYEDSDIRFQYPKTLCGTSWQEEWDKYSCDEDWRIERTKNSMGGLIKILPPYSSYNVEFGGDIEINFVTATEFNEDTKNKTLEKGTPKGDYQMYLERGLKEYPGILTNIYLSNDTKHIVVSNSFPDRYPRYFSFLTDSITLK